MKPHSLPCFFTAEILENYDYGDYEETEKDGARVSRSADNWFDSRTRNRRDVENDLNAPKVVTYRVCVRLVEADRNQDCCLQVFTDESFGIKGVSS